MQNVNVEENGKSCYCVNVFELGAVTRQLISFWKMPQDISNGETQNMC